MEAGVILAVVALLGGGAVLAVARKRRPRRMRASRTRYDINTLGAPRE